MAYHGLLAQIVPVGCAIAPWATTASAAEALTTACGWDVTAQVIMAAMIGRMHHVVLDCPDPAALARFYSELLGQPVTYQSEGWVVVAASDTSSGLAFQLAPDHRPPTWPDPAVPQQVHLDVMVEDVAAAGPRVLALGAVELDGDDVYADPAGHPFCLIKRPRWAPPIE
jgi:catechol 2,3-dioxygenase-like lactoylglutathione lyase family enzyme